MVLKYNIFLLYLFLLTLKVTCGLTINNIIHNTDDYENFISPEDLELFSHAIRNKSKPDEVPNRFSNDDESWEYFPSPDDDDYDPVTQKVPKRVDCFGLGKIMSNLRYFLNFRPMSSEEIDINYYFSSRRQRKRVQVLPGDQFGLEWVDFDPKRLTVIIIHGFMSHSDASWVHNMTRAFLEWGDFNVIAVDWSRGGNTWKYWRAVANTRRVGYDVTEFLKRIINETGTEPNKFYLIGHSLGAHICSYVGSHLGGVSRITGLDPAQPCFKTSDKSMLLDPTDAEFVDIIHTNGRMLSKLGFGLPFPSGHADFYPNGGMKQPGCSGKNRNSNSLLEKLMPTSTQMLNQAVCSHGRAYALFTESLKNKNCSFSAHSWNMTYEGVNSSLEAVCKRSGSCAEMGIRAVGDRRLGIPRAKGSYFVLTTEKYPYCPGNYERHHPSKSLLNDLLHGYRLDKNFTLYNTTEKAESKSENNIYADPDLIWDYISTTTTTPSDKTTKKKNWWAFWQHLSK